ncbi:RING zinc finger-containing protein [Klebsormidium nitens]|uniref:RING zinc finger-containing protein n=1 Tax=Klebsormidium nitens TaxID=105231 RepID=A0A1Y1I168_KLENI|nr:RING zinc finger-containing protein [Klebsormidium nitens]|eukprot:GAQ82516.1 RING zinc finger-containing protein [Klebsormidium nitens]
MCSDGEGDYDSDESDTPHLFRRAGGLDVPTYVRVAEESSSAEQNASANSGSKVGHGISNREDVQASGKEKSHVFVEPGSRTGDGSYLCQYLPYPGEADFIYSSEVVPDLKCGKCKNFLKTPVQVPTCGHKFCKGCILKVVPKVMGFCPTCQIKFDKKLLGPFLGYGTVIQLVRNQRWCTNALCYDKSKNCYLKDPEACEFVGREHELREHAKTCGFKVVRCLPGCKSLLWRKDVVAHADVCKIKCSQQPCTMLVLAKLMPHHKKEECIATVLKCHMMKAGCTEKAQRKDMQAHLDKCPFALKAEIERLKREKEAESAEKEKWMKIASEVTTLKPVKKEVGEPSQKRLRSADNQAR